MISRIIGRGLWAFAATLFFALAYSTASGVLLTADTIGLTQVQSLYPNLDGRDDITGIAQRVAIIDTGIQLNHPKLGANSVVAGINYAPITNWNSTTYGSSFGNTNPLAYQDRNGHGTSVAGIIGSRDPTRLGIAPAVEFVSVRALAENGQGGFSDIAKGLAWVVTNATALNITTVNLSLGSDTVFASPADVSKNSYYTSIKNSFAALKSMDIVVTVASGNNGSSTAMTIPAIFDDILSVGATDTSDHIASYSNRNQYLELLAPGSSINSLSMNSGYATNISGTSYSAPVVAGASVILRELYSQFTDDLSGVFPTFEDRLLDLLQSTSDHITDPATGLVYDRIDLLAAVESVYAEFGFAQNEVPEPASIALFALGGFIVTHRRKRAA